MSLIFTEYNGLIVFVLCILVFLHTLYLCFKWMPKKNNKDQENAYITAHKELDVRREALNPDEDESLPDDLYDFYNNYY